MPQSDLRIQMDSAVLYMFQGQGGQVQRPTQPQLRELAWILTGTAPTINTSGNSSMWTQGGVNTSLALRDQQMGGPTGPEYIAQHIDWEHEMVAPSDGPAPIVCEEVKLLADECKAQAHGTCPAHSECMR